MLPWLTIGYVCGVVVTLIATAIIEGNGDKPHAEALTTIFWTSIFWPALIIFTPRVIYRAVRWWRNRRATFPRAIVYSMSKKKREALREELANYAHEAWRGWMKYLFRFGKRKEDGSFAIESSKAKRWVRQMETHYSDLPEEEKDSDRKEADKILKLLVP